MSCVDGARCHLTQNPHARPFLRRNIPTTTWAHSLPERRYPKISRVHLYLTSFPGQIQPLQRRRSISWLSRRENKKKNRSFIYYAEVRTFSAIICKKKAPESVHKKVDQSQQAGTGEGRSQCVYNNSRPPGTNSV